MKNDNHYFCDRIIPLLEVLKEHKSLGDYKLDPITGEVCRNEKGQKIKEKYQDTLPYYSKLFSGRKVFIDFFRFSTNVYGGGINPDNVKLSQILNNNEEMYIRRLEEVGEYENLVPVLSIKADYIPRGYNSLEVIGKLQKNNESVAVRLDDMGFSKHASEIAPLLRVNDYIMFDIREQNVGSKIMELKEFESLPCKGHKVLLNSPRKRKVNNNEYPHRQLTALIDNSARDINLQYRNIEGYGDYCGMKDKLSTGGRFGVGTALALFYQYSSNKFMSYVHEDSQNGQKDFIHLIPQILENSDILDPMNNCPAIQKVRELSASDTASSWTMWHKINILRYLSQMYNNL